MHPLFSTRSALPAYLLTWTSLSLVPSAVLGDGPVLGRSLVGVSATWGFALFSLPSYYSCRALPLGTGRLLRVLVIQTAIALVWAAFYLLEFEFAARVYDAVLGGHELASAVGVRRQELFGLGILFALLVLAFHYLLLSVEARSLSMERETQALVARERAELGALRAQVHPHFLFNSLNTVSALIGYDPARAREACIQLGTYLRKTLGAGERTFVSLEEEWELARTYLSVEELRLGERLRVEVQLDPAALDAAVPSLLLQPLIENAITHGVSRAAEPGPLRVLAERRGERLLVVVENPLGEPKPTGRQSGLGLANVRARLFAHYGANASLTVERTLRSFSARVDLPAVTLPEAAP